MGTERTRKGQHLFLHLACILITLFMSSGCSQVIRTLEGRNRLEKAEDHLSHRQYDEALKANEDALKVAPETLGDRALYQRAIIYAQPDNPDGNYEKSEDFLARLIRDFAESPLNGEAQAWLPVIRAVRDRDKTIELSRQTILEQKRALAKKESEIEQLKAQIAAVQKEVDTLKGQIERLKEVDLGIEERKRKALPQ